VNINPTPTPKITFVGQSEDGKSKDKLNAITYNNPLLMAYGQPKKESRQRKGQTLKYQYFLIELIRNEVGKQSCISSESIL